MNRKKSLQVVACAAVMTASQMAMAQLTLTGTNYTQNFNDIGNGLPEGWSTRIGASSISLGAPGTFTVAAGTWNGTAAGFKNVAAASLGENAPTEAQNAYADRALGVRQTGAFGDPGAAFTLQIGSTTGRTNFSLTFDAQMLSVQTRSTEWTVQYGLGVSPDSFVDLATYSDPGVFGSTPIIIDSSVLEGIENQSQNVWLRIVALSNTTGSSSRDTFGIDNFALNWTGEGPVQQPPRSLVWNGSSGNWETIDNWLDGATPATWDNTRPDAAVFSNGALPATVNAGAPVAASGIHLQATAPVHTFTGELIVLSGDLTADQSAVFDSGIQLSTASTWAVAADKSVTLNTGLQGSGFAKTGDGTLILSAAAPTYAGTIEINDGTVRVTAADSGVSGLGNGNVAINNGGVLELANVAVGASTNTTAPNLLLSDGGTIVVSGISSYGRSGGFQVVNGTEEAPSVVNLQTLSVNDVFTFQNSLRQAQSGTETFATIRVDGPGRIVLESGGTTANTGFAGSWQIDDGILQIGPLAPGGVGAPINALGFKGGDDEPILMPNSVLLNGGVLALATDVNGSASFGATSVRNPITFAGGAIATTLLDTAEGGKFSGNMTINNGSILLEDPVGTPGIARNLSFTTETGIDGNITWAESAVLNVSGGGVFRINRSTGTTSVGAGAAMTISGISTVVLDGSTDPLSDGTNHVNVTNQGSLSVAAGSKNVGNIDGAGSTTVAGGASLTAGRIRQGSLDIQGDATVAIRAGGTPNAADGTSVVDALSIAGGPSSPTAKLDLSNNSMVIDYTGAAGTLESDIRQLIRAGVDSSGSVGIVSSAAGTPEFTRLGYGDTAALGLTSFGGQPVDDTSILIKFTYQGDADLDGDVDGIDVGLWAQNFTGELGGAGNSVWSEGDWDYDGDVDGIDVGLWAQAFTGELGGGGLSDVVVTWPGNPQAAALLQGLGVTLVPEPAGLSLLALAAAGLAARRRRG